MILSIFQLARTEKAKLLDDEETDAIANSPSGATPRSPGTRQSTVHPREASENMEQ